MSSNFLEALAGTNLYPITDQAVSGLSHAEQVVLLHDCGARLVQLREKFDSPLMFFAQAEAALLIARDRGVKIIINDRVDIALAVSADGVHLGQDDMSPEAARNILGSHAIIGFSTHSLEQARLATQMPVDYVALGPIFATNTKSSLNPPIGLEGVARVREILGTIPLVAIGGIGTRNIGSVIGAGADAAAVISDIWAPAGRTAAKVKLLLHAS